MITRNVVIFNIAKGKKNLLRKCSFKMSTTGWKNSINGLLKLRQKNQEKEIDAKARAKQLEVVYDSTS